MPTRLLLFFSLLPVLLSGQGSKLLLYGAVKDSVTREALSYVTVVAQSPEGRFIEGGTTDPEGQYQISLPPGVYHLHFSFIGYDKTQKIVDLDKSQKLDLLLPPDINTLQTVEVTEERTYVEQKIDRKVINVGKDLQSSGGDAFAVLDQIAEVQTNPDGGVELRGSGNINLLINGKPSPLSPRDLLQQIAASEIQKIEVITSPSAKYQADGLTGIINIITQQKSKNGFTASVNGNFSSNPQYRAGLQLGQGTERTNLRLALNLSDSESRTRMQRSRQSDDFEYTQKSKNIFDGQVKSIRSGFDWFLDDKNELSLSADYTDNSHLITNTSEVEELAGQYEFVAVNEHQHLSTDLNANYRRTFNQKNHYLEADYHFSNNENKLGATYFSDGDESGNLLDYHTRISRWALDYVLPVPKKKATIESGVLYTLKDVSNQRKITAPVSDEGKNRFDFQEKNLGIYALMKKEWEAISLQLGLRYEGFWSESKFQNTGEGFRQVYHNFFPSMHLSHQLNQKSRIVLGYNRRTSRPGLWQLNPFANPSNPFYNRRGNPSLKPEFSNNVELNFSHSGNKISINPGLFYRYKNNLIVPNYEKGENEQVLQSFVNAGNSRAWGAELSMSLKFVSFLRTDLNFNIYRENIEGPQNTTGYLETSNHSWTLKNRFKLNKQLDLDLSWLYRGRRVYRYSKVQPMGRLDLALRWSVLKGKGSLNARLTDVFNTFQSESILLGQGFEEQAFRKWQSRIASLSFNYQLASSNDLKRRNRKNRRLDKAGALE